MSVVCDAFLCGWRVESEIPLPELPPWSNLAHPVDIHIRLGTVPPLMDIADPGRRLIVDTTGLFCLEIPGLCTLSVRDGREIVIDPAGSADSPELRNYLFGTALAAICHQRGVFPLHGSCVRVGSHAVIFSGDSGTGKSTLAAAMVRRGHTFVSDDVCVLERQEGAWVVRPAFPRVKLRPGSLRAVFGAGASDAPVTLQGKSHFQFKTVRSFDFNPVPLAAMYFLERLEGEQQPQSIAEVGSIGKLQLIQSQIFRRGLGRTLGRKAFFRSTTLQLAGAVAVRRLKRSFDLSRLDVTIALIEQAHGVAGPNRDTGAPYPSD